MPPVRAKVKDRKAMSIFLEPDQHRALGELALQRRGSVHSVILDMIAYGLANRDLFLPLYSTQIVGVQSDVNTEPSA